MYVCIYLLFQLWLQKNYRQHIDQVKYRSVADTPEIVLAKKNAQLVSNVSIKHDCENLSRALIDQPYPRLRALC